MAEMLTKELSNRGHDVTVLTGGLKSKRELIIGNLRVIYLPYTMTSIIKKLSPSIVEYLPPSPSALKDILREIRVRANTYDIVHVFAFPLHMMADIIALVSRCDNLVLTVHGFPTFLSMSSIQMKHILKKIHEIYIETIGKYIINKAKIIITVSRYVASQAIQYGIPRDKIRVIPNAIDYEFYEKIRLTEKNKKNSSLKIIISVGRIVPIKGYEYAIKALHVLKQEYGVKDLKYYIVGPIGSMQYYLNLHALTKKLGLTDIVEFKGSIHDKYKLARLILKSNLYLSSSLHETFGISVLEAMALGKPVVATDVPGHRELIKSYHTGILVPPKDHRTLAKILGELLQDTNLYKILALNAPKEAKKYDIKNIVSLYEMVYNEVILMDTR